MFTPENLIRNLHDSFCARPPERSEIEKFNNVASKGVHSHHGIV